MILIEYPGESGLPSSLQDALYTKLLDLGLPAAAVVEEIAPIIAAHLESASSEDWQRGVEQAQSEPWG